MNIHWLHELATEAHATAKDRGFEPPSWDNFHTKMAMVATEIVEVEEALGALGAPSRESVGHELADVALRTLDILHCLAGPTGWDADYVEKVLPPPRLGLGPFDTPGELTRPMRRYWREAVESVRRDDPRFAIEYLVHMLCEAFVLADELGLPLRDFIVQKNEINKKRPHLNGKKDPRA